jgi:hypothetical protein
MNRQWILAMLMQLVIICTQGCESPCHSSCFRHFTRGHDSSLSDASCPAHGCPGKVESYTVLAPTQPNAAKMDSLAYNVDLKCHIVHTVFMVPQVPPVGTTTTMMRSKKQQ